MESQVIVHQSIYIIIIQYLLFIQHYYKGILIFSFKDPIVNGLDLFIYIFVTLFITQERKKNYATKKKEFIVFV